MHPYGDFKNSKYGLSTFQKNETEILVVCMRLMIHFFLTNFKIPSTKSISHTGEHEKFLYKRVVYFSNFHLCVVVRLSKISNPGWTKRKQDNGITSLLGLLKQFCTSST
jgi:hypothetical protein